MNQHQKTIIGITLTIFVLLIFVSLILFSLGNQARITEQNQAYLKDNTLRTAESVDQALLDGYDNIRILSELLSQSLESPEVDIAGLQSLLADSVFDFIEFADKDGLDHNITGGVSDARDRMYYLNAMQGISGMELIYNSRATHETLMMYYSPVYFEDEIVGSLVGVFQATNRITKLISVRYYDEPATTYLCTEEGLIVASNLPVDTNARLSITDVLSQDENLKKRISDTLVSGEPITFTLNNNQTGGCMVKLQKNGWFLVQIFPDEATRSMVSAANLVGLRLVIFMILVYIGLLTVVIIIFRRQQTQVEAANAAKTRFLFNMSHDIRTPMNAILGYANLAEKHLSDPNRVRDCLEKLRTSSMHLLNLINDILDMSRIESGKTELHAVATDVHTFNDNIGPILESLAIAKSIDYVAALGKVEDRYIYLDPLHVNQIIVNVVSNAIKYTPGGGKVRFILEQVSPQKNGIAMYSFKISDTGIGMSEEFQTHIFEAFSREHSSTVDRKQGTGLGLSITKHLVDMMGGTIQVTSSPGEGSVFEILIPFRVVEGGVTRDEPAAASHSLSGLNGKRILLVDDNEMNREIATDLLEDEGIIVETASDGLEAVTSMRQKGGSYYDAILMDIQMPIMDGYEAARQIRALPDGKEIPIIALSANAFEEDRQLSLKVGMNAHLAKPINIGELTRVLSSFLR